MTPQDPDLPSEGAKNVYFTHVFPAILSHFWQKTGLKPHCFALNLAENGQKCAENDRFRHISSNLFG